MARPYSGACDAARDESMPDAVARGTCFFPADSRSRYDPTPHVDVARRISAQILKFLGLLTDDRIGGDKHPPWYPISAFIGAEPLPPICVLERLIVAAIR
jgi:hypothetical protein